MRLLILFCLLSFSATAQKTRPLTLKYVNARIDSLVSELQWQVLNLKYEIDSINRKIEIIRITKDTYRVDTIRDEEGKIGYKWRLRNGNKSTF